MYRMKLVVILISIVSVVGFINTVNAEKNSIYRSFWLPDFHGERLAYCDIKENSCGLVIASKYCHMMGYDKARQFIRDYNVGITNFIDVPASCHGWRCDGFKTIKCESILAHKPPHSYHFRDRRFVFPRYEGYRVDWCYNGQNNCGRRAAYSFCRRMGYTKTIGFKKDRFTSATRALGNQKLCYGEKCVAFAYISCHR